MKVNGRINFIYQEQVISDKFKKREIILEVAENPKYVEYVKFEFIQDKCSLLDGFESGQIVDLEFNLKGRIVDVKGINTCFSHLQGWRISASQ